MSALLTIAIIGVSQKTSIAIAEKLAINNRVLLFDAAAQNLTVSGTGFTTENIELIDCAVDASWEADLILLAAGYCLKNELLQKIKKVATGKIILLLEEKGADQKNAVLHVQQLLAHSKLVQLLIYTDCLVGLAGDDDNALSTVSTIFTAAKFTIQIIPSNI